jgi:hypothetical protein
MMTKVEPDHIREVEVDMEKIRRQREPFNQACRDLGDIGCGLNSLAISCYRVGLSAMAEELDFCAKDLQRLLKAFTDHDANVANERFKAAQQATGNMMSVLLHSTANK